MGKKFEVTFHQVMKCILCYDDAVNIPNARTKERKWLITCYKIYDINVLKKHVDVDHFIIAKKLEEEINNEIISRKTMYKEKAKCSSKWNIFFFFVVKEPFKKDDV
jgi:hypothetical protein